ncbi:uncharacterized protein LOC100571424 [Acyrthosiphon pisum]|uniref:Uncharacterized protein n=1 Tax=Acyrthosiphon pisum TaxID=7029 RepID=A0A8R2A8V2_ACYPI|nr:uncharacterized protein LOC100571424 [Acyrthosiphon pisum]|eukprot:XP_003247189.1 PREDICTED: uncharacterized protein LOC100571424 [Acyrthosiphon pisum]
MNAVKKNKKKLKLPNNGNGNGSSSMSEELVPPHNGEESQRLDEPILILDSDDSSNHSNQSSVQSISDDEGELNTHVVEQIPRSIEQLPIISSYGSVATGYMREYFIRNGFPVFVNHLTSINLISDDDDDQIL